ncbi:MAG TPA: hypothetical protein VLK84_27070 [Longimicrobium sp.]|nr:hypothetical protein [Longimicrobium sp.]
MARPSRKAALACSLLLSAAPAALHAQGSPTVPMEVFAGRIQLADEVGGGDVDVAGVLAGIDVGAYAGLHGFYWRGVETDPLAAGPVQAFGGEGQLNLNVGNGITPFLVGGVARLDFLDHDSAGATMPEDRTMPIVGGGLRLDVGRLGLQAAVRSYLAQTEGEGESDGDLIHSPLFTVGAAFRLGRTGRAPRVPPIPGEVRTVRGDTVFVVRRDTAYASDNFVSIPIPTEGEIYLRYGPGSRLGSAPGTTAAAPLDDPALERLRQQILADLEPRLRGMLADDRQALAELVRRELAAASPGIDPDAERRLLERVDAVVALRVRDELARAAAAGNARAAVAPAAGPTVDRFVPRVRALRPYVGGNLDRPRQFVAGARLDLGPFDPARPAVRLIPEAALGVGQGGTSVMLAGNVAYEAAVLRIRDVPVQPYGYLGAGFLFISDPPQGRPGREAVLNVGYGAVLPVPNRSRGEFFIEHQGVDLFDLNRLLIGLRF